jgi:hypothetical protein
MHHPLLDVREMNANGSSRVCLSVRTFQLQNIVTNFDCILYGHCAAGYYNILFVGFEVLTAVDMNVISSGT